MLSTLGVTLVCHASNGFLLLKVNNRLVLKSNGVVVGPGVISNCRTFGSSFGVSLMFFFSGIESSAGFPNTTPRTICTGNFIEPENIRSVACQVTPNADNNSCPLPGQYNILFNKQFIIAQVRYINIQTWLRGSRVKIVKFLSFFCLAIPKRDPDTKKTTPYMDINFVLKASEPCQNIDISNVDYYIHSYYFAIHFFFQMFSSLSYLSSFTRRTLQFGKSRARSLLARVCS